LMKPKCINLPASFIFLLIVSSAIYAQPFAYEMPHLPFSADSLAPPDSLLHKKIAEMDMGLQSVKTSIEKMENKVNAEQDKRAHFGLSLGYRWLTPGSRTQNVQASVSPIDSTLRLTRIESTSYLFSTSMIFDLSLGKGHSVERRQEILQRKSARTGSRKKFKGAAAKSQALQGAGTRSRMGMFLYNSMDRLCLVSNLNIFDFSNGQKELAFNKSVEGGLGVGYRLNDSMYLGFNWEHVNSMQLYDDIKQYEGKRVLLNGSPLLTSNQLDTDNEDLYYRKTLSGWSVKMIVKL